MLYDESCCNLWSCMVVVGNRLSVVIHYSLFFLVVLFVCGEFMPFEMRLSSVNGCLWGVLLLFYWFLLDFSPFCISKRSYSYLDSLHYFLLMGLQVLMQRVQLLLVQIVVSWKSMAMWSSGSDCLSWAHAPIYKGYGPWWVYREDF